MQIINKHLYQFFFIVCIGIPLHGMNHGSSVIIKDIAASENIAAFQARWHEIADKANNKDSKKYLENTINYWAKRYNFPGGHKSCEILEVKSDGIYREFNCDACLKSYYNNEISWMSAVIKLAIDNPKAAETNIKEIKPLYVKFLLAPCCPQIAKMID